MLGNSKMDMDQLNRCVKHYQFLSPRFSISCFSNYSQKTQCSFPSQPLSHYKDCDSRFSTKVFSPFWRMLSARRASCEGESTAPSATERMEQAEESLKQKGVAHASIVSEVEIQNYLSKETGKDRLIKMFSKDHIGEPSPEARFMYQVTLQSAAVTFLVMSVLAGRQAKLDFIARNRATVFNTRFQAFRRLQDEVFMFSIKEGAKWAVRVSLFSLSLLVISQSIAVYRNKSSVWEYAIASGATFGVMKANLGLRSFVVSTGFGAVMGLFMGFVVLGAMKATNETQQQRHYWQIQKELEKEKIYESKGKLQVQAATDSAEPNNASL